MSGLTPLMLTCVIAGSALGGMARYWLSGLAARTIGETFPWGTLIVNISGAFTIGITFGMLASPPRIALEPAIQHFFIAGFLGSYTTVSSFSLQTLTLVRDRQWLPAAGNAVLSAGFCLMAVWSGYLLGAVYA